MKRERETRENNERHESFCRLFCVFRYFRVFRVLLFLPLLSLVAQVGAQQQQSPPTSEIRISSDEVLLDAIVRDKKGRPVRDLRPEEVEIYEDGVKQSLSSLRLIESAADPSAENPNAAVPAGKFANTEIDPSRQVNLVTMVFDNLDINGRKLARDAAMDFINNGMRSNVLVSVFVVNNRFYVLQPFTANREKLREAVEMATGRAEKQYPDVSRKIIEQLEIIAKAGNFGPGAGAPPQALAAAGQNIGGPGAMPSGLAPTSVGIGASAVDRRIAEMTLNALTAIESAQLDQRARASIYSFMYLAREQRGLTGRKTLLYFSNGLVVPTNLADALRTTISEANRANVSIYAIDARGLSMEGETDRAKQEMARAIAASRESLTSDGPLSTSAFMSSDFAENSIRMNKQGTLAELAESTGGFLAANTNDLRAPLRRIAGELSSYYAISYVPNSREPDGKFRSITVKILRPDVKVQARSGYYAVPAVDGKPVMAYEMPMLAAINKINPPGDFAHRSSVLHFAPQGSQIQHVLLMEVPLSNISFKEDKVKKQYIAHFSVLALIKDEKGAVVHRVSQDYPILGKLERLEGLKKGNFDFTQNFALAPGNYTLQSAVYDFESNQTSLREQTIAVPALNSDIAVSSLAMIRKVDPASMPKLGDEKPLLTPQGRVVPFLGETVDIDSQEYLSFFLTVYLPQGVKDPPALALDFLRDGQVISQGKMDLPGPDDRGRIFHIFSVPTKSLRTGDYRVKATVRQGASTAESITAIKINNPRYAGSADPIAVESAQKTAESPSAVPPAPQIPAPVNSVGISEIVLAASKPIVSGGAVRAAAINITELLGETGKNGAALHKSLLGYTYQLRKVLHVLDDNGQVIKEEFQDYEAYPVRGRHVLIKTANDGKALPAWEIESERKKAAEDLERFEREKKSDSDNLPDSASADLPGYVTASIAGSHRGRQAALLIDPADFLRACDFFDPRFESIQGREMIALDFLPRQGADLPVVKSFVSKLRGTIWIDAVDQVLVRIEARNLLPGIGANGKPLRESHEPKLIYQQVKLPAGDWFPLIIRMNAGGDASAFYGLNWDVVFEFKDYKQFNTTGEQTKIYSPDKKP